MKTLFSYGVLIALVQLVTACTPADNTNNSADPATEHAQAASGNRGEALQKTDENGALVVAFGDSLFAGYQLGREEGFAPALERGLKAGGTVAHVFNAAVSGDTSAAGLRRLGFVLDGLSRKPDLVIVGFGGNDMLRGLSPQETRENLTAILDELKRRNIPAMLAGMVAAPNMGSDYAKAFNPIYPDLAQSYGVPLYPFILNGVIGNEALLLPDGIHPNPRGVEKIIGGIAPLVARALES